MFLKISKNQHFPSNKHFTRLLDFQPNRDRAFPSVRSGSIARIHFPQLACKDSPMGTESQSWHLDLNFDEWVALPASGQRPVPPYKHAATISDEKLYVIGGTRNGRYLSDFQIFDLKTLVWSTIKLNMEATYEDGTQLENFPATSGHSMIMWGKRLILLAGLTKNSTDTVTVRFIDLESYSCGVVETFGNIPIARSGQSVTPFGSKVIMFGGEDRNRQLLNDVHVLDLESMTWSAVETTQTPPSPRFDHAAAIHADRWNGPDHNYRVIW